MLTTLSDLKEDVLRAFILSQSLEPLADKPGCTTRYVDSSPGTKLEYFTVAAANSVWPMLELVDRILDVGTQPQCIFDAAYEAQLRSSRNRNGGKVNYAQILLLTPIITAQALLFTEGRYEPTVQSILDRTTDVLANTTQQDVTFLQNLVDLSLELSKAHHQRLGTSRNYLSPQFIGRYNTILEAATLAPDFSELTMAGEIRNGYPNCKHIFDELSQNIEQGLIPQSAMVYTKMLPQLRRFDVTADCIVVGFYLVLTQHNSSVLFP